MEQLLADTSDGEPTASPLKIRAALASMQLAAVTANEQVLLVKAKPLPLAKIIFNKLRIPIPANINTHNNFFELYKDFFEYKPVQLSLR